MKHKILANASIVTGLSIAERALGFLYRIVLSRLLGAEGLGLYQVALSIFGLFATLGTGGIPITVSKMISKSKADNDLQGEKNAVLGGITACILLTLPLCVILWIFGGKMHFLFSDARSFPVFAILLIGLSFSCVYAVFRGYFWGNKEFLIPSVLEISEEAVMVIVGVLLLRKFSSPSAGAQKAAWAIVISYLFSFSASLVCFLLKGGKFRRAKPALKPLFSAAMPITAVRASASLVNSAVAVLLPIALIRVGASEVEAMKLFGIVSGMVVPLLFIPSTVIGSLSLVLVPEISEDFYAKRYERLHKNIARGLRAALLIACIIVPLFFAVGEDLGRLAFSNEQAGVMLKRSCLLFFPMCLAMLSTSLLNAMGFEKQTLAFYFVGAAAMLLCILVLPKFCGVYAYLIGLSASFTLSAICNLFLLQKKGFLFQKRGKTDFRLVAAAFAVLPLSSLGALLNSLCKGYFGEVFSLLAVSLLLLLLTAGLYLVLGLFPIKTLLPAKKQKQGDF